MTPKETYDLKRKHFIEKSISGFSFLVDEFGFEEPEHSVREYSDVIEYRNGKTDRVIRVSNAYHPVDYGFELSIIRTAEPDRNSNRKMVYYRLKEDQDLEQNYIAEAATALKENYVSQFTGKSWFYDESTEPAKPLATIEYQILKKEPEGWYSVLKRWFR